MSPTIVIADDHPLMLRGLSDFISSKGYNIIGSANNGKEAYSLIARLKPDIAILDIRMPFKTGIEIAEDCKVNRLSTKIILITFDNEEYLYDKAKENDVYGYILKEFAIEEIEACIEHVKDGQPYFSEEIALYLNSKKRHTNSEILDLLTPTELKVLNHLSQNCTSAQIADLLSSSTRTVEKHRSNIMKKLELERSPTALTVWANLNKDLLKNT